MSVGTYCHMIDCCHDRRRRRLDEHLAQRGRGVADATQLGRRRRGPGRSPRRPVRTAPTGRARRTPAASGDPRRSSASIGCGSIPIRSIDRRARPQLGAEPSPRTSGASRTGDPGSPSTIRPEVDPEPVQPQVEPAGAPELDESGPLEPRRRERRAPVPRTVPPRWSAPHGPGRRCSAPPCASTSSLPQPQRASSIVVGDRPTAARQHRRPSGRCTRRARAGALHPPTEAVPA